MPVAEKLFLFSGHQGAVYAVCPSVDEASFYTAGSDGYVARWNWKEHRSEGALAKIQAPVFSLFFDAETGFLFAGREDGGVHVMDVRAGKEIKWIQNHTKGIFDIRAFGDRVFFSGGDGKVTILDRFSLHTLHMMSISGQKVRSVLVHELEASLLTASADGFIRQFRLADFKLQKEWAAHDGAANTMEILPGGRLISGGRDARLNVWENEALHLSIPAHNYAVYQIGFYARSNRLISCSRDKTIKIWNPETFEVECRIGRPNGEGHRNSVNRFLFLEKEQKIISVSDDASVMVWQIAQRNP